MKKFEKVLTLLGVVSSIISAIASHYVGNRSAMIGWICSGLWSLTHLVTLYRIDDMDNGNG
jgi:hypothetical protein